MWSFFGGCCYIVGSRPSWAGGELNADPTMSLLLWLLVFVWVVWSFGLVLLSLAGFQLGFHNLLLTDTVLHNVMNRRWAVCVATGHYRYQETLNEKSLLCVLTRIDKVICGGVLDQHILQLMWLHPQISCAVFSRLVQYWSQVFGRVCVCVRDPEVIRGM